MSPLAPAPLKSALIDTKLPGETWSKWFRDVAALLCFDNNHSRDPLPALTGLVTVGTVSAYMVYVKDRNLIQIQLVLTPLAGGTVALTGGVAKLTNLPYAASHDAVGLLVNTATLAVVGAVYAPAGGLILNLPALAASADKHVATLTYRTDDA